MLLPTRLVSLLLLFGVVAPMRDAREGRGHSSLDAGLATAAILAESVRDSVPPPDAGARFVRFGFEADRYEGPAAGVLPPRRTSTCAPVPNADAGPAPTAENCRPHSERLPYDATAPPIG